MQFLDRRDAGRQLAQRLSQFESSNCIVLGLPRGGVIVAAEVARSLQAPLDVLIVRKIGAPMQPELAIGAVTDGDQPRVVLNHDLISALSIDDDYLKHAVAMEHEEVKRRETYLRQGRIAQSVHDRTVIVVDDGIATGATVRAAIQALRQNHPARVVLAVPVAAPESLELLRPEVDEIICLQSPPNFNAVGRFYVNFDQTTDNEVIAALNAN